MQLYIYTVAIKVIYRSTAANKKIVGELSYTLKKFFYSATRSMYYTSEVGAVISWWYSRVHVLTQSLHACVM